MSERIKELKKQIIEANEAYRTEEAIISDSEYDDLIEELELLSPEDELLKKIGHTPVDETRKRKLPIKMASMNKIKTIEEFNNWIRLKNIPKDTIMIITPKYDGLSLCVNEFNGDAWTRGDGEVGQLSTEHLRIINPKQSKKDFHSFGEVIMSRKNWEIAKTHINPRTGRPYKNPRNMAAGKMNDKNPTDVLKNFTYVRYGLDSLDGTDNYNISKEKQLEILNTLNVSKVLYKKIEVNKITTEMLTELFETWSQDFEIDGVIVEINDSNLRIELGRETSSGNPCFARAFKGNFEQVKESKVLGITWQVSKQGYLKPVAQIEPTLLDGATVSNVTGINGRFVNGYDLKIGSIVKVKRSGMVIPLFVEINGIKVEKDFLPHNVTSFPVSSCPVCSGAVKWNESGVEIMCANIDCEGSNLQKIIAFFEIMEVDGVSDGVCEILFNAGYDTIKKILNMSKKDMLTLEGFASKKAEKTFESIHSKLKEASLSQLQHASGCFYGLGSKKLLLLEHLDSTSTLKDILSIDGFSDISAQMYINGIEDFKRFIKDLPITIKKTEKMEATSNDLNGQSYVFTGVRRADLEAIIQSKGGSIGSGVSKNTSVLVMKEKGSGSSKEMKAISLGVRILDVAELERELGK